MPDEGGKVVVTLKAGKDNYDPAPWIVLHGDDEEDAWNLLKQVAPLEGAEKMSLGELTIAQAKAFQDAWASQSGSTSTRSGSSSDRGRSAGGGSRGGTSTNRRGNGSSGGGKSRTMKSDQWPDHINPEDFDPCPKHGDLIFKDEYEKDNGNRVSARITCSTPFCNAVPTYWEQNDGSFEAN